MRVFSAASWKAIFVCVLVIFTALPALAFDEDHNVVINGAMLHFRVRGADRTNPYLVILHGGPGFSSHMFYAWGPSLEKALNVVYLDQRGCGESARLSVANPMAPTPVEIKGYTFSMLDADIEGVRKYLGADKWFVLGHSFGGMLGVEYVAAHPEHVLGYVHMDGLVSVPQVQAAILDNAAKKFAAAKDDTDLATVKQLRALPPDSPDRMFGAFSLAMGPAGLYFAGTQPAAFAAFYGQIGAAIKPYSLPAAALMPASEPGTALAINDHYLTRDDTPLLAKITVPLLIINGRQDGVVTPEAAEAVHAAIKNSQLVLLDGCGHFPFFEQPQKTTQAVLRFADGTSHPARRVVIEYVINPQGHPTQIHLNQSSGDSKLDKTYLDAFRKASFQRSGQGGVPSAGKQEITISLAP